MPIHLEPRDVTADLEGFSSVLIVSCPICPPVCVSMQKKRPFIEFFKHGLKTQAFEDYITSIREPLEQRGIRTGVFAMRVPIPTMCLWTEGQRNRLLRRAKDYDAVLVLGCDSATYTAKDTLKETGCQVFQAMRVETISNAIAKFRFPLTVEFDYRPMPTKTRIGTDNEHMDRAHD
jgi:hypothetical protein